MRMLLAYSRVALVGVHANGANVGHFAISRETRRRKLVAVSREVANMHARPSCANVVLAYSRVYLVGVHANGTNVGHFAISREPQTGAISRFACLFGGVFTRMARIGHFSRFRVNPKLELKRFSAIREILTLRVAQIRERLCSREVWNRTNQCGR